MAPQHNDNTNSGTSQQQSTRRSFPLLGRRLSRPNSDRNSNATTTQSNNDHSFLFSEDPTESSINSSLSLSQNNKVRIRIVPSIENPSRSLIFSIVERDLEQGRVIKIGRFTDRSPIQNHISFKSKVVSRSHCEIWLDNDGKVQLKDTKSSSGTFVNHVRLSPANTESKSVEVRDGDLVQLGVDYQGGFEEIYRSVKMRFEVNRPNQTNRPMSYSMSAFNNLKNLTNITQPEVIISKREEIQVEECCICLYALAPFQALFVAPCSHSYHFKCIRPLFDSYPGFQCPICRTYSDLDASVAIEAEEVIEKFGLRPCKSDAHASNHASKNIAVGATLPIATAVEEEEEEEDQEALVSVSSSVLPTNVASSTTNNYQTADLPLSTTLVSCSNSLSGIVPPSSPSDLRHPTNIPSADTTNTEEENVLQDYNNDNHRNAGDHRATIVFDNNTNVMEAAAAAADHLLVTMAHQQQPASTSHENNNTSSVVNNPRRASSPTFVEKIKMAFSNERKRSSTGSSGNNKERPSHNSGRSSSSNSGSEGEENAIERSETFFDIPSTTSSSPPSSPRSSNLQPILSRQSTQYNALTEIMEEGHS